MEGITQIITAMLNYNDITSIDWQLKLNSNGEIVEDLDDIEQCLIIVVTTPKGSDPHRPLFGCDAFKYIDNPSPSAVPDIIREIVDAIGLWEPRVKIVSVTPEFLNTECSHVKITIEWKIKNYNEVYTTEVIL